MRVVGLLALAALSCADDEISIGPRPDVAETVIALDARPLDVLFVIDRGPTMRVEQASLARSIDRFASGLALADGEPPDLHVAVTSSDLGLGGHAVGACTGVGTDGRLLRGSGAGCDQVGGPFLIDAPDPAGGRTTSHAGDLADALACMVQVGDAGCPFAQPLAALERAVEREGAPDRLGFLRPEAALAVIVVSDQDDCSAAPGLFDPAGDPDVLGPFATYRCFEHGVVCEPDEPRTVNEDGTPLGLAGCRPRDDSAYLAPPAQIADRLAALEVDPAALAIATLSGEPEAAIARAAPGDPIELLPSCRAGVGGARPAVRLDAVVEELGAIGSRASICQPDLGEALATIAAGARHATGGSPCLLGDLVDVDATRPGVQPSCAVAEILGAGAERGLPRCSEGNPPCWTTTPDPDGCGDQPSQLRLRIDLGSGARPLAARYRVRCQI